MFARDHVKIFSRMASSKAADSDGVIGTQLAGYGLCGQPGSN